MGKILIKTEEEIELIRCSSLIVEKALAEVALLLKPGATGLQADKLAEEVIKSEGGQPSFKNYNGFPYSICFSVNEQVVHGFPSDKPLENGDIVSVDIGVHKNGYHGDFAYTFAIGEVNTLKQKLMQSTREALYKGIEFATAGNRLGTVSATIQNHAEKDNFSVVRELVGHGLGANLHEPPNVPNYGKEGNGVMLKQGMVLAIEPMINAGNKAVKTLKDGWTVVTKDGLPSAHYEHDVAIQKETANILSSYKKIEENIHKNINLTYY